MKNIFVTDLEPHEKYDVKGSWIGRRTKHHIELGKLMKDEDLKKNIMITPAKSKQAWEQMSHDTRFLNTLNIMDYSLLLGIYYIGISTENGDLNLHFQGNANVTRGGGYKPPSHRGSNSSNRIQGSREEDDMKQDQLQDLHVQNGQNGQNGYSEHPRVGSDSVPNIGKLISGKSGFLELNTLEKMETDITKFREDGGLSPSKKRRRAFTAGTGLIELSTHPLSFQARLIEGPGFYIFGIIDIFQEYTWEKKVERFFKVFIQCIDGYGISCIEPTLYRKRFLAKMLQIGIGRTGDTEQF